MNNFKNHTIFCILYQLLQHFAASCWFFKGKPSLNQFRFLHIHLASKNKFSYNLYYLLHMISFCSIFFTIKCFFERATLLMYSGCQTTPVYQFWQKKTDSFQCYTQYCKSSYFAVFHSSLLFFIIEPLPNRFRMSN